AVQKLVEQNLKPAFKPTVNLYDTDKKDFTSFIHTGNSGNSYASLRGNWLTVLQNDGQLLYFNINEKNKKITHLIDGNTQALAADSFYYASQGLVPLIKFKTPRGSFAAAQADVFLNRPHAVLQQFGAGTEFIKPYQLAFEKRLNQQKLTTQNFRSWLTASNTVSISGAAQSFIETDQKEVILPLLFNADKSSISRIHVQVNGQPVFGKKGLNTKKALAEGKITLELNANDNYITMVAEKEDGRQLDPVKYYYYYKPETSRLPKLYFFSAGVSNYKDSAYNLKYAAKDAADIFEAFKYKSYDTIIYNILLDKEVTKQNINKWAKQIEGAGIDDIVIIYFAGHGLLDVKNNFYFALHDMDFQVPEKHGLSYETILDLMDNSASRKKILLLDACHSGAFDRSEPKQVINTGSAGKDVLVNNEKRGLKINKGENNQLSESQAFILMNQLFTDFSNDIGIDVIAASLGNSYALEMQSLKNGLFTYVMIRAVALGMAAQNGNEIGNFTMAQVKEYVEKEVTRISKGNQVPSIRSKNTQSSLINFFYSWKITADNSQKEFLEKYK
ncbi:MAG: caspase family protein, partial [Ferruginibacter sp.]